MSSFDVHLSFPTAAVHATSIGAAVVVVGGAAALRLRRIRNLARALGACEQQLSLSEEAVVTQLAISKALPERSTKALRFLCGEDRLVLAPVL